MPQWKVDLRAAIDLELSDPDFAAFTHGRKHTNDRGCKGPLCLKRGRDVGRTRHRARRAAAGQPVTERYRPTWKDLYVDQVQREYERGLK